MLLCSLIDRADTNPASQLYLDLLGDIDGTVGLLGVLTASSVAGRRRLTDHPLGGRTMPVSV